VIPHQKNGRRVNKEDGGGRRREGEEGRGGKSVSSLWAAPRAKARDAYSAKLAVRTAVHSICTDGHTTVAARRARRAHCETETVCPGRLTSAPICTTNLQTFCAQPHVLSRIEDGHETQTDLELPITTVLVWPSAARGGSVDVRICESSQLSRRNR
jgi:hypothetical protein